MHHVFRPLPGGGTAGALCALVLCLSMQAGARQADSSSSGSPAGVVLQDGKRFLKGAGFILTAPLRWEGRNWLLAGGLAAGTTGTALLDDEALSLMRHNQGRGLDQISDVVVRYGDAGSIFAIAGAGYLAGLVLKDQWLRETFFLSLSAMLLAGGVSTALKATAGRARPWTGLGNHHFRPFTVANDAFQAFPSGHTVIAFSMTTVLSRRIGNVWAALGLHALAASTGLSRMYTYRHWLSDVVFGGAMAATIASSLVTWYEEGEPEAGTSTGFRVIPSGNSLTVVWIF